MAGSNSDDEKDAERPLVAKTAVDLQRLKLQKLMKNPEKPVMIPERQKPKTNPLVPEFVRNVMGSSAGAGSGEFHVYRHLRRKEYARQKCIQEKSQKELLDEEYHKKLEENKKLADELTAKKRAKRLKKKQKLKQKKFKPSDKKKTNQAESSEKSDSENESSDEEKCESEPVRNSSINELSEQIEVVTEVSNANSEVVPEANNQSNDNCKTDRETEVNNESNNDSKTEETESNNERDQNVENNSNSSEKDNVESKSQNDD